MCSRQQRHDWSECWDKGLSLSPLYSRFRECLEEEAKIGKDEGERL